MGVFSIPAFLENVWQSRYRLQTRDGVVQGEIVAATSFQHYGLSSFLRRHAKAGEELTLILDSGEGTATIYHNDFSWMNLLNEKFFRLRSDHQNS